MSLKNLLIVTEGGVLYLVFCPRTRPKTFLQCFALEQRESKERGAHKFPTLLSKITTKWGEGQRYTYRVLQTIQMKLMLLCFWAEPAVLGSNKTALKFKYENRLTHIQFNVRDRV